MNVLSVEKLAKRYGPKLLFENLSFGLERGEKAAIVARNGTGKSTLLKCLAGIETPDSGQVTLNRAIQIGYLGQEATLSGDRSLVDEMLDQDDPVSNAIRAYEHALAGRPGSTGLQQAIDRMEALGAWDHEARAKGLLHQFGLRDLERPVSELSGGQQKRLALAKCLLNGPELVVLDEPTNHLDLDMIELLEGELSRSELTVLLVTHDRYFLDNVCNVILDLDQGRLERYRGNYSYYVEKKALADEVRDATQHKLQGLMRRELEWVRRMPKARGTKSKSRVAAFDDLKEAARHKNRKEDMRLEIATERLGGKVIEVRRLVKSFGAMKIVDKFDRSFKRSDRIGLVGPNGVGKSTFIELITGRLTPDGGKVVIGDTVRLGYYDQKGLDVDPTKRVLEVVQDIAEVIPLNKGRKLSAAQLLERFLFDRDQQFHQVGTLSGGEKRRLYLCTVLMRNPNVLVLDEPTNDLDIPSLNALEEFLADLDACILVVTHDRFFLDKICDCLLVFEGDGRIREHVGSYTELRSLQQRRPEPATDRKKVRATERRTDRPRKMTYAERLELERLEVEIPAQETRRAEMLQRITDESTPHEQRAQLSMELEEVARALDLMTEKWIELSEKADP
ncbi:MAG: ABC-F family ATP-binding cassette domain-containing protein [Flavobacteriales bacterium]|nr:ABC-F family ATP-binding cassette domain-containing protein [Flavobacteriales bacterium]